MCSNSANPQDLFVAMVQAKAEVDLRLSDFEPRSQLRLPSSDVSKPRFPVIDYHNHLDSQQPEEVLRIMDECDIERLITITMQTGDEAIKTMKRFSAASGGRIQTIGWMDWSDVAEEGFIERSIARLERLVENGAVGIKFWKDLGLSVQKADGSLLRIDDEWLAPIFERAAELGVPVMFHTADPDAFFDPIDKYNERYEELAAHPEWAFNEVQYSKRELLEQRNRVFARHPETTFVGAHLAESGEDLGYLKEILDRYPNLYVDISARTPELGRQPYTARNFLVRYADRILFGTDLLPEVEMYRLYYRFLESSDEYFDYPTHASRQGRWQVYGMFLPEEVLRKIYRENALRLLSPLLY